MKSGSLVVAILTIVIFSCSNTSNENQMAQFKGLWKMHNHEIQDDNGNETNHNWMNGGAGYIIYDGNGHMAVHITPNEYRTKKVNWKNEIDSLDLKNYRPEFELFSTIENQSTTEIMFMYLISKFSMRIS